jgi:hypothetical protein
MLRLAEESDANHETLVHGDDCTLFGLVCQCVADIDAGPKCPCQKVMHLIEVFLTQSYIRDRGSWFRIRFNIKTSSA